MAAATREEVSPDGWAALPSLPVRRTRNRAPSIQLEGKDLVTSVGYLCVCAWLKSFHTAIVPLYERVAASTSDPDPSRLFEHSQLETHPSLSRIWELADQKSATSHFHALQSLDTILLLDLATMWWEDSDGNSRSESPQNAKERLRGYRAACLFQLALIDRLERYDRIYEPVKGQHEALRAMKTKLLEDVCWTFRRLQGVRGRQTELPSGGSVPAELGTAESLHAEDVILLQPLLNAFRPTIVDPDAWRYGGWLSALLNILSRCGWVAQNELNLQWVWERGNSYFSRLTELQTEAGGALLNLPILSSMLSCELAQPGGTSIRPTGDPNAKLKRSEFLDNHGTFQLIQERFLKLDPLRDDDQAALLDILEESIDCMNILILAHMNPRLMFRVDVPEVLHHIIDRHFPIFSKSKLVVKLKPDTRLPEHVKSVLLLAASLVKELPVYRPWPRDEKKKKASPAKPLRVDTNLLKLLTGMWRLCAQLEETELMNLVRLLMLSLVNLLKDTKRDPELLAQRVQWHPELLLQALPFVALGAVQKPDGATLLQTSFIPDHLSQLIETLLSGKPCLDLLKPDFVTGSPLYLRYWAIIGEPSVPIVLRLQYLALFNAAVISILDDPECLKRGADSQAKPFQMMLRAIRPLVAPVLDEGLKHFAGKCVRGKEGQQLLRSEADTLALLDLLREATTLFSDCDYPCMPVAGDKELGDVLSVALSWLQTIRVGGPAVPQYVVAKSFRVMAQLIRMLCLSRSDSREPDLRRGARVTMPRSLLLKAMRCAAVLARDLEESSELFYQSRTAARTGQYGACARTALAASLMAASNLCMLGLYALAGLDVAKDEETLHAWRGVFPAIVRGSQFAMGLLLSTTNTAATFTQLDAAFGHTIDPNLSLIVEAIRHTVVFMETKVWWPLARALAAGGRGEPHPLTAAKFINSLDGQIATFIDRKAGDFLPDTGLYAASLFLTGAVHMLTIEPQIIESLHRSHREWRLLWRAAKDQGFPSDFCNEIKDLADLLAEGDSKKVANAELAMQSLLREEAEAKAKAEAAAKVKAAKKTTKKAAKKKKAAQALEAQAPQTVTPAPEESATSGGAAEAANASSERSSVAPEAVDASSEAAQARQESRPSEAPPASFPPAPKGFLEALIRAEESAREKPAPGRAQSAETATEIATVVSSRATAPRTTEGRDPVASGNPPLPVPGAAGPGKERRKLAANRKVDPVREAPAGLRAAAQPSNGNSPGASSATPRSGTEQLRRSQDADAADKEAGPTGLTRPAKNAAQPAHAESGREQAAAGQAKGQKKAAGKETPRITRGVAAQEKVAGLDAASAAPRPRSISSSPSPPPPATRSRTPASSPTPLQPARGSPPPRAQAPQSAVRASQGGAGPSGRWRASAAGERAGSSGSIGPSEDDAAWPALEMDAAAGQAAGQRPQGASRKAPAAASKPPERAVSVPSLRETAQGSHTSTSPPATSTLTPLAVSDFLNGGAREVRRQPAETGKAPTGNLESLLGSLLPSSSRASVIQRPHPKQTRAQVPILTPPSAVRSAPMASAFAARAGLSGGLSSVFSDDEEMPGPSPPGASMPSRPQSRPKLPPDGRGNDQAVRAVPAVSRRAGLSGSAEEHELESRNDEESSNADRMFLSNERRSLPTSLSQQSRSIGAVIPGGGGHGRAALQSAVVGKPAVPGGGGHGGPRAGPQPSGLARAPGRLFSAEQLEEFYTCPITQDVMHDPVMASDGFTYERSAIEEWVRKEGRSPMTNAPLSSRDLQPNILIKQMINATYQD